MKERSCADGNARNEAIGDLTLSDFGRHPVWLGVHNHDIDEPWYKKSDEETYRPWTDPLPFSRECKFPFLLVYATFALADGSIYPGYFNPQREDWDEPIPPRRMRDGNYTEPKQWSARRGGSPLSILALHSPTIFIEGRAFDFHLRRDLERRKTHVQEFYAAIGKQPDAVFPVSFHADPSCFNGITSGKMDGFYSFPLDKTPEIDTGANLLGGEANAVSADGS